MLVHRGNCGDAVGVWRYADELRDAAGDAVADAACDGACWAAPAATVLREGYIHRFARLDESGVEPALSCFAGDCDEVDGEPGDARGGLMARLGRTDGALGAALAAGAYEAAAKALELEPTELIEAVEAMELTGRGGAHFPVWAQVAFRHRRRAAAVGGERRRRRARGVQGPPPLGGRPPPSDRRHGHRRPRDRMPAGIRLHQRPGDARAGRLRAGVGGGSRGGRRRRQRARRARRARDRGALGRRRLRLRRGDGDPQQHRG